MKIALIGTADILTLLKNFKESNVDFFLPDNIYNPSILVGSNLILNEFYIKSEILGENKEILDYKTQSLFPVYSYYYRVETNFRKINLVKKEFNVILKNYDKVLLSIPNNFMFKTKVSGVYFYNTIKEDEKQEPKAIFYSYFNNKIASFSNGNLISDYYLEPVKNSIKILYVKENIIEENISNKIKVLNLINNNDIIIENYKKEVYG